MYLQMPLCLYIWNCLEFVCIYCVCAVNLLKFDTYLNIILCTHFYCNEIFTGLFIDKCTKATTHVYKPLVVVKWKTSFLFLDFTWIWWLVFGRLGYKHGVNVAYIIYRVNFHSNILFQHICIYHTRTTHIGKVYR